MQADGKKGLKVSKEKIKRKNQKKKSKEKADCLHNLLFVFIVPVLIVP
ncbi:MAG: hypothetical protein IJ600_04935 [Lachnospiraceae bacterium]|nr:hypothetical protein [Lachnospiraceae bacterium]